MNTPIENRGFLAKLTSSSLVSLVGPLAESMVIRPAAVSPPLPGFLFFERPVNRDCRHKQVALNLNFRDRATTLT
jgi:hypothetical protein